MDGESLHPHLCCAWKSQHVTLSGGRYNIQWTTAEDLVKPHQRLRYSGSSFAMPYCYTKGLEMPVSYTHLTLPTILLV